MTSPRMPHSRIGFAPLLAATALLLVYAEPSLAVINCNSTITYSSNVTASDDYERTTASALPCIKLTSGADFNFNGHKITCKGGYVGSCGAAIQATATGTNVTNGTAANIAITSDASSAWEYGVLDAQQVLNLRINQAYASIANYSIDATKIDGNVITKAVTGIDSKLSSSTSQITNNFVSVDLPDTGLISDLDRYGIIGVGNTSGSGPRVQYNMVENATWGIYGQQIIRLLDNIDCNDHPYGGFGDGAMHDGTAGTTASHNLCCEAPASPGVLVDVCVLPSALSGGFHLWP